MAVLLHKKELMEKQQYSTLGTLSLEEEEQQQQSKKYTLALP
jgi:hypothetical protein